MAFASLVDLPPRDSDGAFRVVVESPKGSTVKLTYEEQLGFFTVSRALPLGVSYPYDWGFIPGTRAADGDPVDALVIHDASTYPGVVLSCRLLGLVVVIDRGKDGGRVENSRVIAAPNWNDRPEFDRARDLPRRAREELAQFFLSTTFFTAKNPEIRGWKGPTAAEAFVRKHTTART
jgi:inorganic pyrophosphatase